MSKTEGGSGGSLSPGGGWDFLWLGGGGVPMPGAGVCDSLGLGWGWGGMEGSGFGEGGSGCRGARSGTRLLSPAVHAAASGVHEEVADGVELQAQLL